MGTRKNRIGEAVLSSTQIYVFSRSKKNNEYSSKPQFYYIKVDGDTPMSKKNTNN